MIVQRRAVSDLHTLASWALRMSPSGWALVRRGKIAFSNHSFDALDRGSLIGPGWSHVPEADEPRVVEPAAPRSLREIAVDEAQALFADGALRRRHRFVRAGTFVEMVAERPLSSEETHAALVLVRDVTDQVQADEQLAAMRERLNETERTRVASELAVGVAHDLGNLVAALRARVASLPASPELRSTTAAMRAILEAQAALVSKLQAVTHPRHEPPVRLNLLDDVFQPAIQMVESSLRMSSLAGGARISVGVDTSTPAALSVDAPRDELINVVINLILNARDAMPTGGSIRLAGAPCPGGVLVRVEDDGTGIAPHDLPRIFDPLFSTKGSDGMGMGLATAAALMRRLRGSISARNRPAGGACIELTFVDLVEVNPPRAPPRAR